MTHSPNQEVVSVIIPCYNHAHFLGEAITSVINQTYPYFEIIVVDDGPTDDTAQIAKAYPNIHYMRQKNLGLSRSRNIGLSYSKGISIVFLDADDSLFQLSNRLASFWSPLSLLFFSVMYRSTLPRGKPGGTFIPTRNIVPAKNP